MKISRQVGTVNEILNIYIQDATVSTGAGLANVSSTNVTFAWCRNNQVAASSGTCSTSTGALGLYFVPTLTQTLSTNMLGWYQFCVPDGVFASGTSAALHLYGAPNMAPVPIEIELTKTNNQQYTSSTIFSSTNVFAAVNAPVGVSTITVGVNASTVSGLAGVSTVTDKAGYGVSSLSIGVNASTVSGLVGVSTVTDKAGYGVSSLSVGVNASTVTDKAGYSVSSITAAAAATIADKLLGRNVSSGGDGGRTVGESFYVLRNKVDLDTGIVYGTDDTTSSWAFTVSTKSGNPVVSIDPA